MKPLSFRSAARLLLVAALLCARPLAVVAPSPPSGCVGGNDSDGPAGYVRLPDGRTTYGFDDGGCFLCADTSSPSPGAALIIATATPLSGDDLAEGCRGLCDADPACVAFTVGRGATMPAQEYLWGTFANCCLERRRYPPGAFVDAGDGGADSCRRDAMCWTRYERKERRREQRQPQCEQDQSLASLAPTSGPAKRCAEVWPATTFTEEEVQAKIKFIGEGCPRKDDVYESLLAKQYDVCRAEAFAESVGMSVIVLPESIYTLVSVNEAYRHSIQTG